MSELQPSQIMYAVYSDLPLRQRIEALVRSAWWNNPEQGDPGAVIPLGALSWACATNPTIRAAISSAVIDEKVSAAIETVPDGDIEYVVLQALTRLTSPSA